LTRAGWFVLMVREMKPGEMISGARLSFPNMDQQFWIASLAYAALMGIATTLLIKQTRASSDPTQKSRLMYMLMGTTTILLSGFFSVFLTHALRLELEWLSPLGHVAATFCMAFIAYSLTTSHLYQFSELLRKMLAFMVMTVILIAVFGSTHFLSTKLLVPYIPRSDFFCFGHVFHYYGTPVPSASISSSKLGR
jgi:hypothetical protein